MFRATRAFKDKITGHKEPSLRIGKRVPKDAVNLAYYYNPTATDSEKVLAADPPRNTIDTRFVREKRYLYNIPGSGNLEHPEPPISKFQEKIHYGPDEEGYEGSLYRKDETVQWYGNAHFDSIVVQDTRDEIVVNKGDVTKSIQYGKDANGYEGTLYFDAAEYDIDAERDVTETVTVDYSIEDFEIKYSDVFGCYLTEFDINNGPWKNEPDAINDQDYCWPARIELGPTKLQCSDGNVPSTDTNNRIANYINNLPNNWDGSNTQLNDEITYTSKPTGTLFFSHLEHHVNAGYEQQPEDSKTISGEFPSFKTDNFQWNTTTYGENGWGGYNNIYPGEETIKLNGSQLNRQYKANTIRRGDYTEIENFINIIQNIENLDVNSQLFQIREAINLGYDIVIYMTACEFIVNNESINMLVTVDGENLDGDGEYDEDVDGDDEVLSDADLEALLADGEEDNGEDGEDDENEVSKTKENVINTDIDKSFCHYIVSFSYKISDVGFSGKNYHDIGAVYHSIYYNDDDTNCSVKRTITNQRKEVSRWIAHCHYSGIVNRNWTDYDGQALYEGPVHKGNSIGNQNADWDNEILMFPDKNGNLRQIVETTEETTNSLTDLPDYEIKYKNIYQVEADTVYITNVFRDSKACFYKYMLKKPIYDYRGPNEKGFYQGDAVNVFMNNMKDLPNDYKYNIRLIPAAVGIRKLYDDYNNETEIKENKCYYAELYTSFVSSSTDTFKVIYNAFDNIDDNNKILESGIEEDIYNAPFMVRNVDYELIPYDVQARQNTIHIMNYKPMKDTRKRISFNWHIEAINHETNEIFTTVMRTSSILNKDYVLPCEYNDFIERAMIISPKINGNPIPCSPIELCFYDQAALQAEWDREQREIYGVDNWENITGDEIYDTDNRFIPVITDDNTNDFTYKVIIDSITDDGAVNASCRVDGTGYIVAETTMDTGFLNEKLGGYTKKLDIHNPYWLEVETETSDDGVNYKQGYIYEGYKIKCIDSRNITVRAPREEKLLDSWYPLIQFGHFSKVMDQYGVSTKVCYTMPEYDKQHYSNKYGQPYVDIEKEQVTILNPHMIKTKCYPLYLPTIVIDDNVYIHNNKTYKVFYGETRGWEEAEEICQSMGGHLVMPKDSKEFDYIVDIANKYQFKNLWIGCHKEYQDIDEETGEPTGPYTLKWNDNTDVNFTNWLEDGLDDSDVFKQYIQVIIKEDVDNEETDDPYRNKGKWFNCVDTEVSYINGYICEIEDTVKIYKKVEDELFDIHIKNISFSDGIIITEEALSETDTIIADYTYLEEFYNYRGYWRDKTDFVRIDLNPNMYHTYNDPNMYPSEVSPSKNLFNKIIYFFMRPTAIYEISLNSLDAEGKTIEGLTHDGKKKIEVTETKTRMVTKTDDNGDDYQEEEEYTETHIEFVDELGKERNSNSICLYHKINDSEPDSDADIMVGSVYIRSDTSLHSTIITDSRTRGGGVLSEMKDSLRQELEPESDFYLDIGYYDGKPYQENGVIIVRLDNRLLKDFGGRFTMGDVEQKVKRWLGSGIYPIIEFVDSYKKRDLPQYNLEVDDSYSTVIEDENMIPEIFLECIAI